MQKHLWTRSIEDALAQILWQPGAQAPCRQPWFGDETCWLVRWMDYLKTSQCDDDTLPSDEWRPLLWLALNRWQQAGWTLRTHLPHLNVEVQREWLGERLVLLHQRWLLGTQRPRWTSLISSRLGRLGRGFPQWPRVLDKALLQMAREHSIALCVPGTALAPLMRPLLQVLPVERVQVELPAPSANCMATWLSELLQQKQPGASGASANIYLSPARRPALPHLESVPQQDRVSILWGRHVKVFVIRNGGTVDRLVKQRLCDPRLPLGAVSVWIDAARYAAPASPLTGQQPSCTPDDWLHRGAVGWWLPSTDRFHLETLAGSRCRPTWPDASRSPHWPLWPLSVPQAPSPTVPLPLCQWTSRYALCGAGHAADVASGYLTHCVRGAPGAIPDNVSAELILRAWSAGRLPDESPLHTLLKIIDSRRIRSSARLMRREEPCVSFSAVPLDQLHRRRSFQAHLSRWDWEPYGVMIRGNALAKRGAQPVIYGDDQIYRSLTPQQQPFFQPARRRRARHEIDHWEHEREWRLLGDLNLNEIPPSKVLLFVQYENEARAMATISPWPIIWLREVQTRALPACPARRPHRASQTNRN